MKEKIKKILKTHAGFIIIYAIIINSIIEMLGRLSISSFFQHLVNDTLFFFYNVVIIALTFSLSYFFKRKKFIVVVISVFWVALGIANYVVLSYRITPFAAIDLFILQLDLDFLSKYMSIPLAVGLCVAIILGIYAILKAYLSTTQTEVKYKKSLFRIISITLGVFLFYQGCLATGVFETRITNMQDSYDHFGFVSCFARSAIERGIEEPEEYSQEQVLSLLQEIETDSSVETTPNIVVVQLESFFDVSLLKDVTFSENPISNFTELMEQYPSGMLDVAVVGAGTANTEFEVLTGMNVNYFGTGEYPYETILREQTCLSIPYSLKDIGYNTFAIHNNTATFYGRQYVYSNLGFDTFISSEFMETITMTPNEWIKDENLTVEIMKCLESTEEQDFVFTVSVQGHGSFPEEETESDYVTITSSPYDEGLENQVEYYANQLYEMDIFVSELTEEINNLDEPTILVFYGDHIPSLDITAEDLTTGNNYQTQYVVYSNYELSMEDQELETYQLLATVLDTAGISNSPILQLHQSEYTDDYEQNLELLQYDLLYGENYSTSGELPEPTDLQLGIGGLEFTITPSTDQLVKIEGDNITSYSHVFVNDKEVDVYYYIDHVIYIESEDIELGDEVVIKQIASDNTILVTSNAQEYQ